MEAYSVGDRVVAKMIALYSADEESEVAVMKYEECPGTVVSHANGDVVVEFDDMRHGYLDGKTTFLEADPDLKMVHKLWAGGAEEEWDSLVESLSPSQHTELMEAGDMVANLSLSQREDFFEMLALLRALSLSQREGFWEWMRSKKGELK